MATSQRVGFLCTLLFLAGCKAPPPSITFTVVPDEGLGGPKKTRVISGHVSNSRPGDHIILFAHTNLWWVQPDIDTQMTAIGADGNWTSQIHLGSEYAAALVRGSFQADTSVADLPRVGKSVLAIATVHGTPTLVQRADNAPRTLHFSGYDWQDTYHADDYTGIKHYYMPQNAEVDSRGRLHLRIKRLAGEWTCAEVNLPRTLGYGTYRLTFQNPDGLDPAAEFAFYTYSTDTLAVNHREMEFHLSRWGEPKTSNAEYVIEPYYIAANVHRFELGGGEVISTLNWSPGQAAYSTSLVRGGKPLEVARWTFSAGVPPTKDEQVFLSLCPFGYPKQPEKDEAELLVTRFEFLP